MKQSLEDTEISLFQSAIWLAGTLELDEFVPKDKCPLGVVRALKNAHAMVFEGWGDFHQIQDILTVFQSKFHWITETQMW